MKQLPLPLDPGAALYRAVLCTTQPDGPRVSHALLLAHSAEQAAHITQGWEKPGLLRVLTVALDMKK